MQESIATLTSASHASFSASVSIPITNTCVCAFVHACAALSSLCCLYDSAYLIDMGCDVCIHCLVLLIRVHASVRACLYTCHLCTHAFMHECVSVPYRHACMLAETTTQTHTRSHARMCTRMHALVSLCARLCMHAYALAYACMHMYMHAYVHACICTCMHMYMHACIYT